MYMTIQFLCTPNNTASFYVLLLARYGQSCEVEAVPPELQPLLLFALDDPVKRVQLAAAVCQYAIGTPNAHARDILRKTLQHGKLSNMTRLYNFESDKLFHKTIFLGILRL